MFLFVVNNNSETSIKLTKTASFGVRSKLEDILIISGVLFLGTDTKSALHNASILVSNGKIRKVASGRLAEEDQRGVTREIDARNYTVLPGLTDLHVHLSSTAEANYLLSAYETTEYAAVRAQHYALKTLEAGFTTVRDAGASGPQIIALRDAINNGFAEGPRIYAAGKVLSETGGHADSPFPKGRICDGVDDCRKATREQIKMGADFIKICTSGGGMSRGDDPNEPQLTISEVSAIVEEAHVKHKRVAAHAQSNKGIRNAVLADVDTIEHALYLDPETCEMIKQKGSIIVPTMVSPIMTSRNGLKAGIPEWAVRKTTAALEPHQKSLRMAKEMGVKIGFGTDAGTPFNFHGSNALEFGFLIERGNLTNGEALFAATGLAAQALGADKKFGTVVEGKLADLIVVKGDPTKDVKCLEDPNNVKMVIKEGTIMKDTEKSL